MLSRFVNLISRPFVGDQTTARLAFQPYQGLAASGINGDAGFTVYNSPKVLSPANVAIGPTHKRSDPTATGNPNWNLDLQPLSDNRNI